MLITLDADAAPLARNASHILHASARSHSWSGVGSLSVKSFLGGRAFYDTGQGRFRVDEHDYLVLNHGTHYQIDVDADERIESFCVFMAQGFEEDVARVMHEPHESLLDGNGGPFPIRFVERTYDRADSVGMRLAQLRAQVRLGVADPLRLSGHLHALVGALLHRHALVKKEMDALPMVRGATRDEIYRRLHRARDWARAALSSKITLSGMARVACLSTNHFLRTFRQAFGMTPHAWVTQCRMEEARRLLATTDKDVSQVCGEVGFESVASFSRLFRRHHGVPPSALRLKH